MKELLLICVIYRSDWILQPIKISLKQFNPSVCWNENEIAKEYDFEE